MSTLSGLVKGSGGGGYLDGPRNATEMWNAKGTYTWNIPSTFDNSVSVKVYCWGAGGNSGTNSGSGNSYGGGGGGLAIKEVTGLAAGGTVTVTIGAAGDGTYASRGGDTSFGSHCSATAGNDGQENNNPSGNPNTTGENSNPQNGVYGQGGIGIGGDINRRGGGGGYGSQNPGSGYGGGGGSAPSPQGYTDGFRGGRGDSYCGGSGASINFPGTRSYTSYTSAGGAGTAGNGSCSRWGAWTNAGRGGSGGAGLNGAGGRGASCSTWSNGWTQASAAGDGQGTATWGPNHIFLGGGGGGGGTANYQSSERTGANAGCGGPGAGGGSVHSYSSSADNSYFCAGSGGVLGGGGGACQYSSGGSGGNGGGGGATGYGGINGHSNTANRDQQYGSQRGGDGLVFIQYKVT